MGRGRGGDCGTVQSGGWVVVGLVRYGQEKLPGGICGHTGVEGRRGRRIHRELEGGQGGYTGVETERGAYVNMGN